MQLRIALSLVVVLLATACAHQYTVHAKNAKRNVQLPLGSSFQVGLPEDGRYGEKVYAKSGVRTSQSIAVALRPYSDQIVVDETPRTKAESLAAAAGSNIDFLIMPVIKHWEDRATEWTGVPDQVRVELLLFDVERDQLLDTTTIHGTSRWGTFGGDHPEDLLEVPVQQYVKGLFPSS